MDTHIIVLEELPSDVTVAAVADFAEEFGHPVRVSIERHGSGSNRKANGRVRFDRHEDAESVLAELQQRPPWGRRVRARWATGAELPQVTESAPH